MCRIEVNWNRKLFSNLIASPTPSWRIASRKQESKISMGVSELLWEVEGSKGFVELNDIEI
jgi:hypothetical protein